MPLAFLMRRRLPRRRITPHALPALLRSAVGCAVILAAAPVPGAAAPASPADGAPATALPGPVRTSWSHVPPLRFGREEPGRIDSVFGSAGSAGIEASFALPEWRPAGQDLLGMYRSALMKESRRRGSRDDTLGWTEPADEEGYPARRARRQAERIFEGANNRLLSHFLDRVVGQTAALRAARGYVDGVSLDVAKGGGVRVARQGRGDDDDPPAARFTFVAIGDPHVEMRSRILGNVEARVELSLASPGVSASLTRRFARGVKGRLGAGYEDSGQDRWISAGLQLRF